MLGQPNAATRTSLLKLNQPLQRSNHSQKNISYIAPIIWNDLPNSLKTKDNLNTYEHFFHQIRNEANNIYSYFYFIFFCFNAQALFIFIVIFIIIALLLL